MMMTSKELMHVEDFLSMTQTSAKTFQHLASEMQDSSGKQLLQQLAQKQQQHTQTIGKHLSNAQSLQ
ncbi:MAG: ferritin-like domain-containing protein [Sporomusaceae bacterium]|nr:ferritin-like domain-containing protein [Sporomusaceae bacterium]